MERIKSGKISTWYRLSPHGEITGGFHYPFASFLYPNFLQGD